MRPGTLFAAFILKHRRTIEALPKNSDGSPNQASLRAFLSLPEVTAEMALLVGVAVAGIYLEAEAAAPAAGGMKS